MSVSPCVCRGTAEGELPPPIFPFRISSFFFFFFFSLTYLKYPELSVFSFYLPANSETKTHPLCIDIAIHFMYYLFNADPFPFYSASDLFGINFTLEKKLCCEMYFETRIKIYISMNYIRNLILCQNLKFQSICLYTLIQIL